MWCGGVERVGLARRRAALKLAVELDRNLDADLLDGLVDLEGLAQVARGAAKIRDRASLSAVTSALLFTLYSPLLTSCKFHDTYNKTCSQRNTKSED